MKCSKLLLGLALVCGITAANAATIQDAIDCELGKQCAFPSDGSIVYFRVENLDEKKPTLVSCKLVGDQTDGAHAATALAYPGKDADFTQTTIGFAKPAFLSIYLIDEPADDGLGQVKVRLKADRTYPPKSIGVTCLAAKSEIAA